MNTFPLLALTTPSCSRPFGTAGICIVGAVTGVGVGITVGDVIAGEGVPDEVEVVVFLFEAWVIGGIDGDPGQGEVLG